MADDKNPSNKSVPQAPDKSAEPSESDNPTTKKAGVVPEKNIQEGPSIPQAQKSAFDAGKITFIQTKTGKLDWVDLLSKYKEQSPERGGRVQPTHSGAAFFDIVELG